MRNACLAILHATLLANADRVEPDNKFTAIAKNMNMGPVSALIARANPNLETVDDPLRHDLFFTQPDWVLQAGRLAAGMGKTVG